MVGWTIGTFIAVPAGRKISKGDRAARSILSPADSLSVTNVNT
jgi:hypothetical protein